MRRTRGASGRSSAASAETATISNLRDYNNGGNNDEEDTEDLTEEDEGDIGKDEKVIETENCSISQAIETICHPDLVYSEDTSNIVLRCLITFFCLFFAMKAFLLWR